MNTKNYESPDVEIIETDLGEIICQSGSTDQYGEGNTGDWF